MKNRFLIIIFIIFLFMMTPALSIRLQAQESDSNPIRLWGFASADHNFTKSKLYLSGYVEYDHLGLRKMEDIYGRVCFGIKPLKWLKTGVNYVPFYEAGIWSHFVEGDVTGTLRTGNLKISVRERYRYGITTRSNELRSRLRTEYAVHGTKFTPYLAVEVFTRPIEWKKTRHFAGCMYDVTDWMQLDWYYVYHTFRDLPDCHVFAFGLNFTI